MLLSYNRLVKLVEDGVINADPENINGASIDVRLGGNFKIESHEGGTVKLYDKQSPSMTSLSVDSGTIILPPGEFILAETVEVFNLPNSLSGLFLMHLGKSSPARSGLDVSMAGLDHAHAGWCDPGWHGSTLTLELKNILQYHSLELKPGMKIGQVVIYESEEVPEEASYKAKGQYNNQKGAQESKGVR